MKNEVLCIQSEEFCIQNDEFCRPVAVVAMLLLNAAPEPSAEEQAVCGSRHPMSAVEQAAFLRRYQGILHLK